MNIRKILLAGFLLTFAVMASAYYTTQPPPNIQNTHVTAHAVYNPSTADYTYRYTITSGAGNTGVIDYVNIDITTPFGFDSSVYDQTVPLATSEILSGLDKKGMHILPVTLTGPAGWEGGSMSITGEAGWIAPDNVNTVTGLALTAGFPPGIRRISIQPHADFAITDVNEDSSDPAIHAAEKAYFDSITYTTWTLGPIGPSGSVHGNWDQFRDTLNKAMQIGWVPDKTLAHNLVTQLAKARSDFEAGHDSPAKNDLRTLITTMAAATDSQRRPEVADLVNLYAADLMHGLSNASSAPIPYDPLIKLSPAAETLSLGQPYTLTATAINVTASDAPISGSKLSLSVTAGPDAGRQLDATTDSQGRAIFRFVGTHVGTDPITVSMSGAPIAAHTEDIAPFMVADMAPPISAQARVTWSGGPDLVVPLFSPPRIESQGGNTIHVQDMTINAGTTTAGASVTRYYLSATPPPFDLRKAVVIGERRVPVLAPGAESSSGLHTFVLPSSIPAGQYFMAACADADNAVIELDETNNCSYTKITRTNGAIINVN
ncbi:MAG: CARDB domain-containing protein [Sulfuricaulis sp.]